MSNEQCPPEALAQAREQVDAMTGDVIELLVEARATVIELRRQLAEEQAHHHRTNNARVQNMEECKRLRTELATERQRAEAAEREVLEWREAFASIDDFDWAPKPLRPSDLRAYGGSGPSGMERARGDAWKRTAVTTIDALEASEAKRKALREALVRIAAFCGAPGEPDCRDTADAALAADGKDTPV